MSSLAQQSERVAATVARCLPSCLVPVFGARFTYSHLLFDEYVYRLAARVFVEAKLDAAVASWGSVEDVVARAGLDPRCSIVPVDWMLRHLAARGALARQDGRRRSSPNSARTTRRACPRTRWPRPPRATIRPSSAVNALARRFCSRRRDCRCG